MTERVDLNKVIKSFLAADLAKEVENQANLTNAKIIFQKTTDFFLYYENEEILKMVKDPLRLTRYTNCSWSLQEIKLTDMGVWLSQNHATGDLQREWCKGSVVDTALEVEKHKEVELRSIKKIRSMIPLIDIILEYFPPILVSGGEIRKASDTKQLPFDVDDGSHRCIAAALSGKTEIKCYVGMK